MFNRLVALVQCLVDTLGGTIGKGVEIRSKLFACLVPAIAFGLPELVKAWKCLQGAARSIAMSSSREKG